MCFFWIVFVVFFSSRRRHTRCALVTGVQMCALPISTFMHLSAASFNELKSKGETAMVLGTMTDADYEGLRKMQDRSAQANFMFPIIASGRKYFRGTLKRVGSRSEEHTSELQSLMRISYAVF